MAGFNIPVLDTSLWSIIVQRRLEPSLEARKKYGMLYEKSMPTILSYMNPEMIPTRSYLRLVPQNTTNQKNLQIQFGEICPVCYGYDHRLNYKEGLQICATCGFIMSEHAVSLSSYAETYGPQHTHITSPPELPRQYSSFVQKRTNHFKSWLQRLQGKENYHIPKDIISMVHFKLKTYGLLNDAGYDEMRFVLKQLGLQKYYNHTFMLLRQVTGSSILDLSTSCEKKLLSLFILIQESFGAHRGVRVNMLSYTYLITKMCESLGWDDMAHCIPVLKSRSRLRQQDVIWRQICQDVGLSFKRSLF